MTAGAERGQAMIAPDFCGAYDGAGNPLDGAPVADLRAMRMSSRPAAYRLRKIDEAGEDGGVNGCFVVLSATGATPLPARIKARALAAMDAGQAVYVMGATAEDVVAACNELFRMVGGGRA